MREFVKVLPDKQKHLEYIQSLQNTICMNYRNMTEAELTVEEKVWKQMQRNGKYAINNHNIKRIMALHGMWVCSGNASCFCLCFIFRCWTCGIALFPCWRKQTTLFAAIILQWLKHWTWCSHFCSVTLKISSLTLHLDPSLILAKMPKRWCPNWTTCACM